MDTKALDAVALSIRTLSMDAVQKATSGHPGLPMGCAELGAFVYGQVLRHDPDDPAWPDRDRFVLSGGHGCMLLYSLFHLSGYGLSIDEIRSFRQLGSRTPGHPERGRTPGVEATAGPLGQGISNAVGMAIAETMLAEKFNTPEHRIVDHYTYALASDGDLMEGVASEACSLAGHLGLGKLIVFYDSNHITIEGSTDLAFTEDVRARFDAYGWHTQEGDAYDYADLEALIRAAREEAARPSLILLHTTIGKGSPGKGGTAEAHGAPLGAEEVKATKRALGVAEDAMFYVAPGAYDYFERRRKDWRAEHRAWGERFEAWATANPHLRLEWDRWHAPASLSGVEAAGFAVGEKLATRKASEKVLGLVSRVVPNLVGGSGDLAPSTNTIMKGLGDYTRRTRCGRNFHFGVREHGMGAISNGMALHGGLRPYCATFLVFSDYMRPSIRLAAIMRLPVIYVFTHDSVYVGEDGPTHQPVEHLAALRLIPDLEVLRPADAEETELAWHIAIERSDGPTALALTRQNLEVFPKADPQWRTTMRRGAYVASDSQGRPSVVVIATGSEVTAALKAKASSGRTDVRVVSMPSRGLFLAQDASFRDGIVPPGTRRIVVEAGVSQGWEVLAPGGTMITIDRFGESGTAAALGRHFGVDHEGVAAVLTGKD
jgi:transketolase